jgi:hypothetical protein
MLDDTHLHAGQTLRRDWQARVRDVLEPRTRALRVALGRGMRPERLDLRLIKDSPDAVTMALSAGPETGVLKLYDGPDAARQYAQDRDMLRALRDSGLVPRLRHYCDGARLIVTERIAETLDAVHLDRWGAEGLGYRLGDWCARYDATAPARPAAGTWLDHARAMAPPLPVEAVAGAAAGLAAVPLAGQGLAHNDAALSNILYDPARGVLRCDFARAAWRPRGWDYIVGRHAVMQRFPGDSAGILMAMTEGFAEAHRGALRVDELDRVADILFALLAVAGRSGAAEGRHGD